MLKTNPKGYTDSQGRLVNEKGYLIDKQNNIVNNSGIVIWKEKDLKQGEFMKIFPFSKFNVSSVKGDLEIVDPNQPQ